MKQHLIEMDGLPVLRMAERKDGPVITDNGNFVFDVKFNIQNPKNLKLNSTLSLE